MGTAPTHARIAATAPAGSASQPTRAGCSSRRPRRRVGKASQAGIKTTGRRLPRRRRASDEPATIPAPGLPSSPPVTGRGARAPRGPPCAPAEEGSPRNKGGGRISSRGGPPLVQLSRRTAPGPPRLQDRSSLLQDRSSPSAGPLLSSCRTAPLLLQDPAPPLPSLQRPRSSSSFTLSGKLPRRAQSSTEPSRAEGVCVFEREREPRGGAERAKREIERERER
jgi:hypothetical protein